MNPPNLQQSPNPLSNPYISPLTNPGNPQQNSQANNQPNQNQTPQQSAPLQAIMQSLATRQQATDPRFASQVNPNPPSPSNSIQNPGINGIAGQQNNAGNQVTAMPSIQPMQLQPPPQQSQSNPLIGAISQLLGADGQGGQAVSSDPTYANMCEAYAEQQLYGHQGIYPSAISAYQANAQKGNINTSINNIPAGAQVFFNANAGNGYNGHTGVMNNDGTFSAPLSNGNIMKFTVPQWLSYSGQQYLGYAVPTR